MSKHVIEINKSHMYNQIEIYFNASVLSVKYWITKWNMKKSWKIVLHLRDSDNLLSSAYFQCMLTLPATIFYIFRSLSFDLKIAFSLGAFLIIFCISERVSPFSVRAHGSGQLSAQHPVFVHESLPRKVSSSWSETRKVHTFTSGARPRRTFQLR